MTKKKRVQARQQEHFETVNLFAAGIDIGSQEHYVAVPNSLDEKPVRSYGCFTADLNEMADWLVKIGVTTVAMESTGIYWIPAFEILESRGLEVILVNAHHVKNVTGRKTDVKDCQWLQQLHTFGLLAGAFRPEDDYCELRAYMRQREMLVSSRATHIQHMQKSLRLMNLLLDNVVSDITGKTGLKIIREILAGERDTKVLANYRDKRCKQSMETIAKSLEGNYQKEHLFTLKQAVELYDMYEEKLNDCDIVIEQCLSGLHKQTDTEFKKKKKQKKKTDLNFEVSPYLYSICGTDLTAIEGLSEHTILKVLSETGTNMHRWKTAKHFVAWMGLSPNNKISGGKVLSSKTIKTKSRAKQAFKMAAYSLVNAKSGLGAFCRRLRSRVGAPKAISATARKIAVIFYNMLKNKTEYTLQSQEEYNQAYKKRLLKNLSSRAKQLGMVLVPNEATLAMET